ncbi:MAG: hypothetical protein ACFFD2_06230 [Promethearchaeota archaeon]
MSAGKITGGIIALIGGAFVAIACLIVIESVFESGSIIFIINWLINILVAVLAIVGGALGIASKGGAGGLALAAGIIAIICPIIGWVSENLVVMFILSQYSLINYLTGYGFIWILSIESFIMLVGGIVILASPSDY